MIFKYVIPVSEPDYDVLLEMLGYYPILSCLIKLNYKSAFIENSVNNSYA